MSDHNNLVSRRNALKGFAVFTGTSAAGMGAILHATQPAAATDHLMAVDDIVIETNDGEITEMGISDLWFEASWENITTDLYCTFSFAAERLGQYRGVGLGHGPLGVNGEGSETFGYGDGYASEYAVDFEDIASFDIPLRTTSQEFLTEFNLSEDQDEQTIEDVRFRVMLSTGEDGDALDMTNAEFDVTVQRVEASGGANDGEADPYGEG